MRLVALGVWGQGLRSWGLGGTHVLTCIGIVGNGTDEVK